MKYNTSVLRTALSLGFVSLTLAVGHAESIMVTTAEGPTSFNTTLGNVNVENFSGMSSGTYKNINWTGVGTIDRVSLVPNNQYGGTPTSKAYPVQSTSAGLGGVSSTTISLSTPSSYFGMFWSAGDASNNLSFYNGKNLVASFSTQSLMGTLPSSYYGNPNPANLGQDRGEPFGFINFIGGAGTSWDKVVLSNPSGSGFESQSWTSRAHAICRGQFGEHFRDQFPAQVHRLRECLQHNDLPVAVGDHARKPVALAPDKTEEIHATTGLRAVFQGLPDPPAEKILVQILPPAGEPPHDDLRSRVVNPHAQQLVPSVLDRNHAPVFRVPESF